jgi:hypothetical protein
MEVYRRREGMMSRPLTGIKKIKGVESSLIHASSGTELLDEVVFEGGLEESFMEETVDDSGQDLRSLGLLDESSPMTILKRRAGVIIEELEVDECQIVFIWTP